MYLNTRSKIKSVSKYGKLEKLLGVKRKLKKGLILLTLVNFKDSNDKLSNTNKFQKKMENKPLTLSSTSKYYFSYHSFANY